MQTKLDNVGIKKEKAVKATAESMAKQHREISVSEFFLKNRHLLGFDNPRKALLTAVKEAVDNSLDAAEEMGVTPHIHVKITQVGEDRFTVMVEDNGPGIVKEHVGRVFGKLLYGSKFHRLKCSRGQQGIGISSVTMYGQLTTGKPMKVWSKTGANKPAWYFEIFIDTSLNEPKIVKEAQVEWEKEHGIKLEVELVAKYFSGKQSVEDYLKQVAIANPHLHLLYEAPDGSRMEFPRAVAELPKEPKEIKPHPYGIELGMLMKMLSETKARTLSSFLQTEFCRVSSRVAKEICEKAKLFESSRPSRISAQEVEALYKAIQETKIMAPPTDCLVPIGEEAMIKGLKKEVPADFYAAVTRPPAVYRGNPFQIECAIAYGGQLPQDDLVKLLRFANRVPLMYQQSACATYNAVVNTAWKNYNLSQSKGALPTGPAVIMVHMSSVWVPFTSEAKEAVASYPEIIHEIKLALQECGRQLGLHIRRNVKAREQREKASLFESYIPTISESLSKLSGEKKEDIALGLQKMLKKHLPAIMESIESGTEQKNESKD